MKFSRLSLLVPSLILSGLIDLSGSDTAAEGGVEPSPLSVSQATAIHRTPELISAMINHGVYPTDVDLQGKTTLMWAAETGQVEIARQLLGKGADIHARDWWGRTAMVLAIMNNHREVVDLLFSHAADITS